MVVKCHGVWFELYRKMNCPYITLFYASLFIGSVELCSKSPHQYYRPHRMRSHILIQGEYQPGDLENSHAASGPIDSSDFINHVPHSKLVRFEATNVKIKFDKDQARWMTKTLRRHLFDLLQHVENQWPNREVYIQVHDTWNPRDYQKFVGGVGTERHQISTMSQFHWAGRGIDMSLVSARYVSKDIHHGKLAQLALYSAGFDWCIYKSVNFLHCSVKKDSTRSMDWYGCFANNSTVYVEHKRDYIHMRDLKIGDKVLTIGRHGDIIFSPVIGFFHQNYNDNEQYVEITTFNNSQSIIISPGHLLYRVSRSNSTYPQSLNQNERDLLTKELFINQKEVVFASSVMKDDQIFIADIRHSYHIEKVKRVLKYVVQKGKIAPLTQEGTLIVNNIFVSCISSFQKESYAFLALSPYFAISRFWDGVSVLLYYYTSCLIKLADILFPHYFYEEV